MKIRARITLTVEFIRTRIFFIFMLCLNTMTSMIKTNVFFDLTDFQVQENLYRLCCCVAVQRYPVLLQGRRKMLTFWHRRRISLIGCVWFLFRLCVGVLLCGVFSRLFFFDWLCVVFVSLVCGSCFACCGGVLLWGVFFRFFY